MSLSTLITSFSRKCFGEKTSSQNFQYFGQIFWTNFQFYKLNFIDENKTGLGKLKNIKSVPRKEKQQTGSVNLPKTLLNKLT